MKIGVNYLNEVVDLVKNNKLEIDYYKFPSISGQMVEYNNGNTTFNKVLESLDSSVPLLLHGLNPSYQNICSSEFERMVNIGEVKSFLDKYNMQHVSVHFDGGESDISVKNLIQQTINNINFLHNSLGRKYKVLLENVEQFEYSPYVDPEVISEVVYKSEACFLLDISHAYISSRSLEISIDDYLDGLPLSKVYEIHINGWDFIDGVYYPHTKVNEEGYNLLKRVLERVHPQYVTIEYGYESDVSNGKVTSVNVSSLNEIAKKEVLEQVENIKQIVSKL